MLPAEYKIYDRRTNTFDRLIFYASEVTLFLGSTPAPVKNFDIHPWRFASGPPVNGAAWLETHTQSK